MYYDCGFDTYFDAMPERGEYLDENWNIGSPENRFIVFGRTARPRPSPPQQPEAFGTGG